MIYLKTYEDQTLDPVSVNLFDLWNYISYECGLEGCNKTVSYHKAGVPHYYFQVNNQSSGTLDQNLTRKRLYNMLLKPNLLNKRIEFKCTEATKGYGSKTPFDARGNSYSSNCTKTHEIVIDSYDNAIYIAKEYLGDMLDENVVAVCPCVNCTKKRSFGRFGL